MGYRSLALVKSLGQFGDGVVDEARCRSSVNFIAKKLPRCGDGDINGGVADRL